MLLPARVISVHAQHGSRIEFFLGWAASQSTPKHLLLTTYACTRVIIARMRLKLAQIEARLQSLVEGSAARLFPNRQQSNNLAYRLVEAMRAGLQPGEDGSPIAPNLYTIVLHPEQASNLLADREGLDGLRHTLSETASQAGVRFSGPLMLQVEGDLQVGPDELLVLAKNSRENLSDTTDMPREDYQIADLSPESVPDAFLIVDGTQIVQIAQPVVNIGRRDDNQLVIDDPRVSRVHAQLRLVRGRFILFDLDSTGGTFVNGERIRQTTLQPGDVISLSGLPIVFGQDGGIGGETESFTPEELNP